MAEILGLGITHYPPLSGTDDHMADILRWTIDDPGIPKDLRSPEGWPEEMRTEYGSDGGAAAAAVHRKALVAGLGRCREALDAFQPDVVLIWGDDQYENFTEEVVPAFCVLAYDEVEVRPFAARRSENIWGEPSEASFTLKSRPDIAKALASGLLEQDFDVAYSYRQRAGAPFPHAFTNSVLYLDYERRGFEYPILPVSVNCYGRHIIGRRGGMVRFDDIVPATETDPPSPSPRRCFALGAATARTLAASPWRVALVASSSWSHAFLNDKDWHLYPAMDADRRLYRALEHGDWNTWRETPLGDIEANGQQEMLNWFCLLGAMAELGRQPTWTTFVETHVMNSNKCFAVFEPAPEESRTSVGTTGLKDQERP